MKELQTVLDGYIGARAQNGKASKPVTPEQIAIAIELPQFFESTLEKLGYSTEAYKIEGSYGAGNMSHCPWVSVFDRRITTSAQDGYYIVLLFAEDMKSCWLSLNQGFTSYAKSYASQSIARRKAAATAARASTQIDLPDRAIKGRIDLAASRDLARGYQVAAIASFRYEPASLPSSQQIQEDLGVLMIAYSRLHGLWGSNLNELAPPSEIDFQEDVNETSEKIAKSLDKQSQDASGPEPKPEPATIGPGSPTRFRRNPRRSAAALVDAEFKCEVNPAHETFISHRTTHAYMEAHHLIPMGFQSDWVFNLDVRANIVALCPTCHRLLHHGDPAGKRSAIQSLFLRRSDALAGKGLELTLKKLIAMYSGDLSEDE